MHAEQEGAGRLRRLAEVFGKPRDPRRISARAVYFFIPEKSRNAGVPIADAIRSATSGVRTAGPLFSKREMKAFDLPTAAARST